MASALASGACGRNSTQRDWGLHREWTIARDCTHPERPATLVEVPWTMPAARSESQSGSGHEKVSLPEVRSGMRVTLWRHEENADVRLSGVAVSTARRGESVKVRAGLGVAILDGIVRGPALVELAPREEGN